MKKFLLLALVLCALVAIPITHPAQAVPVGGSGLTVAGILFWPALLISLVGMTMGFSMIFRAGSTERRLGTAYILLGAVLPFLISLEKARPQAAPATPPTAQGSAK